MHQRSDSLQVSLVLQMSAMLFWRSLKAKLRQAGLRRSSHPLSRWLSSGDCSVRQIRDIPICHAIQPIETAFALLFMNPA